MALDLNKTALQVDRMALELKAREDGRRTRLGKAMEALASFDVAGYDSKRRRSAETLMWNLPGVSDSPRSRYLPPSPPRDFRVVAADGSHIDVDRHIPARCFLINIGVSVLTYGSHPDARLFNQPTLYAQDDELVIRERTTSSREQAIEGAVLGAKRTVDEIRALAAVVRELPPSVPTLALMDGSLIMLGLVGHGYHDFVLRQLIKDGFVQALDDLRQMASSRPLAVASYVSLPRSAEVANALRLGACPYEVARCDAECGSRQVGARPCDAVANGLMDRELFWETLEPGERSGLFASSSSLVATYYQGHEVMFFYVHAGEEIARVEVPAWVAEKREPLDLTHALVVDQCRRGPGYPAALMEAHEQAVVTGADRRSFAELVEAALYGQRLAVYSSEKNRSKRLRWL